MVRVAAQLKELGVVPRFLRWTEAPPAGDADDFIAKRGAGEPLASLIAAATEAGLPLDPARLAENSSTQPASDTLGSARKHKNQAETLVSMADDADLFHTPDQVPYATVRVGDHNETWTIRSRSFKRWLMRSYYEELGGTPNAQAIADAIGMLEARALFDGRTLPVFTRLAEKDGCIYLDMANEAWHAVEISPSGWAVVSEPPVKFKRPPGMLSLPEPIRGGRVDDLRPFLNIEDLADWQLLAMWWIMTIHPRGPYPILVLHGEQGSAKTTAVRVLRETIDPNVTPVRAAPNDIRDLMIAAANSWVQAYDNLSHLPAWLSDALCRLSTGGGFSTRELYTDTDETLFAAVRPVALNGIEELATRGDLLDRCMVIYLPVIPEERRRPEAVFWAEFHNARPRILGALLDVAAAALQRLPSVQPTRLPRMADFALWATAAEGTLGWEPGAALAVYGGNRSTAHELALDASPVASIMREFVDQCGRWSGTATDLVNILGDRAGEGVRRQRGWPQNGRALSNVLRRLAPNMRAVGIEIGFGRTGRKRRIDIARVESKVVTIVTSADQGEEHRDAGDARDAVSATSPEVEVVVVK
jgi:hypothetical protein